MTGAAQPIEWYLARDNKQYGPLSDAELMKLVEFHHLKAHDLVWRTGFSDWTPAQVAFPKAFQPLATPPAPPPAAKAAPSVEVNPTRAAPEPSKAPSAAAPSAPAWAEGQPSPTSGERGAGQPKLAAKLETMSNFRATLGGRLDAALPSTASEAETIRPRPSPSAPAPAAFDAAPPAARPLWIDKEEAGATATQARRGAMARQPAAAAPSLRAPATRFDTGMAPLDFPPPAGRNRAALTRHGEEADEFIREPIEPLRRPRRLRKLVAVLMVIGLAGAAGWATLTQPQTVNQIMSMVGLSSERIALATQDLVSATRGEGAAALREQAGTAAKPMPVANLQGFAGSAATIDGMLQAGHLWQVVRSGFPEWYSERVQEAARLVAEKKPDEAVTKHLVEALISLRRKNSDHAFQSSLPRLQQVARTFRDSLEGLAQHNNIACYALISSGEGSRGMITMFRDPQFTAVLQNGLAAIFESIAEGRRTPQTNLAPRRSDYDVLTQELTALGWKETDLSLFADAQELAKAPPEQVCRMVREWFTGHLAIRDKLIQQRLLVESIRPVVSG